jgi:Fic family protein
MEYRGKQDLWVRQRPAIVEALRQEAMVLSVESSNRIEGVTVSTERLRPLVLGKARPRDRSEEEVAGYRRALEWIFAGKSRLPLSTKTLLGLHKMSHAGATDAGPFKVRDKEIIEIKPSGERIVRFRPTPAGETPAAAGALCESFSRLTSGGKAPPLLLTATAILDFLCIHPFRDGNGRVSRLLTNMLLKEQGFVVCRFVSLERLVEESKEEYYRVLGECSAGWAEGRNKILPWWNYFLTILRRAYVEFGEKMEQSGGARGKSEIVRHAALSQMGPFTLAQVAAAVPDTSQAMVKKVLAAMREEGLLTLEGRGRGARWQVVQ